MVVTSIDPTTDNMIMITPHVFVALNNIAAVIVASLSSYTVTERTTYNKINLSCFCICPSIFICGKCQTKLEYHQIFSFIRGLNLGILNHWLKFSSSLNLFENLFLGLYHLYSRWIWFYKTLIEDISISNNAHRCFSNNVRSFTDD